MHAHTHTHTHSPKHHTLRHERTHKHTHTHTAPNTTHSDADMSTRMHACTHACTHTHTVKGTSESLHTKHNFTSKDSDTLQAGSHWMKMTTDLSQSRCHELTPCLGSLLACWTEGDVLCTQLIALFSFYIALFSASDQTHCTLVVCNSE